MTAFGFGFTSEDSSPTTAAALPPEAKDEPTKPSEGIGTKSWTFSLISITSLWKFECKDGTNVGLAAGRYSEKRRPELYRTPHALQSDFRPIGPSLHCGVSLTSQCEHLLLPTDLCFILVAPDSRASFFFFFSFLMGFVLIFEGLDSENPLDRDNSLGAAEQCVYMVENRERLEQEKSSELVGNLFSLEHELRLPWTETGPSE